MPSSATGRARPGLARLSAASLALGLTAASIAPAGVRRPDTRPQLTRSASADQIRSQEWALERLQIPRAWRYSKGEGVTVAVLDTGVDSRHPDLTGQVIKGSDFTDASSGPGGKYWGHHGTAMASIIAGHGHNEDDGVIGVAPRAKILSIRVTWENNDPARESAGGDGRNRDAVAQGIREAVDRGAQIINMSLGGGKLYYNGNPAEETAIEYARSRGVTLIASAGNDGGEHNRRNYPAAYPGVIAVGAVDRDFQPARFTNHHTYVSLAAPGVDIVSADAGRGYVLGTGTSPATAFVAGIAALIRSRYPTLSPDQIRKALEQGVTHAPSAGRSASIGAGVTNATKAMLAAARINRTADTPTRTDGDSKPVSVPASEVDTSTDGLIVWLLIGCGVIVTAGLVVNRRRRVAAEGPSLPPVQSGPETTPDIPVVPLARPKAPPAVPAEHASPAAIPPVNVPPVQSVEISFPSPKKTANRHDPLAAPDFTPSGDVGTPLAEQSWAHVSGNHHTGESPS